MMIYIQYLTQDLYLASVSYRQIGCDIRSKMMWNRAVYFESRKEETEWIRLLFKVIITAPASSLATELAEIRAMDYQA